ncbi:hypothetical protein GCM10007901_10840 [Dyella acidisoli]|uniref:Uncharacterized protein n=1 Tax=Dyella acidisoli TaxID=1867834 RepID=A0ABQ5XKP9_9GAMM|nr:hypothetical protein GCM10007901_10840 [Dyella acidisoli]
MLEGIDALAHTGLRIAFNVVEHVKSPVGVQAVKYSRGVSLPEGRNWEWVGRIKG